MNYIMDNGEKFDLLRAAAIASYPSIKEVGNIGGWAYDTWAAHNQQYFDGMLNPCSIIWGLTAHGHALGFYNSWLNRITLHESLVDPKFDKSNSSGGEKVWGQGAEAFGAFYASDVLLHEMIHQKIYQVYGHDGSEEGGNSSHNNPIWVAEVNRLAPLLDLPYKAEVIRQKRIDKKVQWHTPPGIMSRDELSRFPTSVRPQGYGQQKPA